MSKAVQFKMPTPKTKTADSWVEEGVESHLKTVETSVTPVAMKRLTLDVPAELHARVKLACVQRGKTMLEEICRLMDAEFPAKP